MNYENVCLEKAPCVPLQKGAEPEQSSGKEEKEGKGTSEIENSGVVLEEEEGCEGRAQKHV